MRERCDHCKYWGSVNEHDWEAYKSGLKRCEAVQQRWDITDAVPLPPDNAGAKAWDEREAAQAEALRAARAYVQDGSQYVASLYTGPDFFCALYLEQVALPEQTERT